MPVLNEKLRAVVLSHGLMRGSKCIEPIRLSSARRRAREAGLGRGKYYGDPMLHSNLRQKLFMRMSFTPSA